MGCICANARAQSCLRGTHTSARHHLRLHCALGVRVWQGVDASTRKDREGAEHSPSRSVVTRSAPSAPECATSPNICRTSGGSTAASCTPPPSTHCSNHNLRSKSSPPPLLVSVSSAAWLQPLKLSVRAAPRRWLSARPCHGGGGSNPPLEDAPLQPVPSIVPHTPSAAPLSRATRDSTARLSAAVTAASALGCSWRRMRSASCAHSAS